MKKSADLTLADRFLSKNLHKRAGELFFLKWEALWLLYFAGIVITGIYETFDEWSYTKVGLMSAVPPIVVPLLFPSLSGEQGIPWYQRYTTKANIFVGIASWIGNYFWTHYFYKVLGCEYTFALEHRINNVPWACILITHSYFHIYHGFASIGLRVLYRNIKKYSTFMQYTITTIVLVIAGYSTAVMEVATISSFPYYRYEDAWAMWVIGSGFYGLYFLISFPWFARIDEQPDTVDAKGKFVLAKRWTLTEVAKDALAYAMITTMMLDLWRITVGNITDFAQNLEVSWIF